MIKFEELQSDDVEYIEDLIESSNLYLQGKLSNEEIATKLNSICTIYFKYEDYDLLMFKGVWSEIDDIEQEIREGKTAAMKLGEYLKNVDGLIKMSCRKLIDRYTPLLNQLKKKFSIQKT